MHLRASEVIDAAIFSGISILELGKELFIFFIMFHCYEIGCVWKERDFPSECCVVCYRIIQDMLKELGREGELSQGRRWF